MKLSIVLGFFAVSVFGVVIVDANHTSPAWRALTDEQMTMYVGSDKGKGYKDNGDCDSENIALVNMGQNTIGCLECDANSARAGDVCICCDNGGAIDMGLIDVDPKGNTGGVAPDSAYAANCGPRSAATCVFDMGGNPFCNPRPTGRNCFGVNEYLLQSNQDQ